MKRMENAVVLENDEYEALKKAAESQKTEKPRMTTSTKVLLALGLFALTFIVTMIVIFCVYGSVPDTLIQYVLGAGGVEAVALAGIKISKVMKNPNKELIENDLNDQ